MYRKILVPVDHRAVTQCAIDQAIALAQLHRADIFFFSVLSSYDYPATYMLPAAEVPTDVFKDKAKDEAERLLTAASTWAERCGVHNHRALSFAEDCAHAVAEAANKRHCDLIVVGTEEQNAVVRLISGSIIPGLISKANVPVLVCRASPLQTQRENKHGCSVANTPWVHREAGSRRDDEPND